MPFPGFDPASPFSPYDADMGGDKTIDGVTVTAPRTATPPSPRRDP